MKTGLAILAAALLLSTVANAGQTSLYSSLPIMPAATPFKADKVAGLTITSSDFGIHKDTKWVEVSTLPGFCLAETEGTTRWTNSAGASERGGTQEMSLNHLTTKDGKPVLERTSVHFDPAYGTVAATARTRVELVEVARSPQGVVVLAYREGPNIMLLARGSDGGMESHTYAGDMGMVSFVSADGCSFAGVRLDARKPENGAIAQLAVTIPPAKGDKGAGTRFVIDASLSKVARDPEPKISVRIRGNAN